MPAADAWAQPEDTSSMQLDEQDVDKEWNAHAQERIQVCIQKGEPEARGAYSQRDALFADAVEEWCPEAQGTPQTSQAPPAAWIWQDQGIWGPRPQATSRWVLPPAAPASKPAAGAWEQPAVIGMGDDVTHLKLWDQGIWTPGPQATSPWMQLPAAPASKPAAGAGVQPAVMGRRDDIPHLEWRDQGFGPPGPQGTSPWVQPAGSWVRVSQPPPSAPTTCLSEKAAGSWVPVSQASPSAPRTCSSRIAAGSLMQPSVMKHGQVASEDSHAPCVLACTMPNLPCASATPRCLDSFPTGGNFWDRASYLGMLAVDAEPVTTPATGSPSYPNTRLVFFEKFEVDRGYLPVVAAVAAARSTCAAMGRKVACFARSLLPKW
eukprot:gene26057-11758_t